jgi:hypothetical protein
LAKNQQKIYPILIAIRKYIFFPNAEIWSNLASLECYEMKSGASYFREAAGVQKKYDLLVNKMTERKSQIDKRALRARAHSA